jgi:serine/threonine protein kinase
MSSPRASASAPTSIGRFQIQKVLDQGPSSILYLALDETGRTAITLKTAAPGTVIPGLRERYERAQDTARKLDHPGVLPIRDLGQDPAAGPYQVLDPLEGAPLSSLFEGGIQAFPALHLLIQLLHILEAAARAGILHGDLEPHAIWITPEGRVVLQDFGGTGPLLPGSEAYAAPERLDGGVPSAPADQFSLAALAFHLLSGKQAFPGATAEDVAHAIRIGALRLPPKMPLVMQKVFLKAMDVEPKARYASLRDFMAVLIAAAPLEEDRLDSLLSFLDGEPLAIDGLELPSHPEAPRTLEREDLPSVREPLVDQVPILEQKAHEERRLLDLPGVIGFAVFDEAGTLLTTSPHAGDLADAAPSVYFRMADLVFREGTGVRHFLFRTRPGLRYLLYRKLDTLIVIKLMADANPQEILHGLDGHLSLS